MGITNIPMLNGEIVMGISLMLLFIICRIQLGFGTRPPFVDTHLACANDSVYVRFGNTLEGSEQKIIQSLAVKFLIDRDVCDLW